MKTKINKTIHRKSQESLVDPNIFFLYNIYLIKKGSPLSLPCSFKKEIDGVSLKQLVKEDFLPVNYRIWKSNFLRNKKKSDVMTKVYSARPYLMSEYNAQINLKRFRHMRAMVQMPEARYLKVTGRQK